MVVIRKSEMLPIPKNPLRRFDGFDGAAEAQDDRVELRGLVPEPPRGVLEHLDC